MIETVSKPPAKSPANRTLAKSPANRRRLLLTPGRRDSLLEKLAQGWSVSAAAKATGISRQTYYRERTRDEEFCQAADEAIDAGSDVIEDELFRRGVLGTKEPVGFHQGRHTGEYVTRYDTRAAIFLLKARNPDRFKDRAEVNMDGGLADRLADARARLTPASGDPTDGDSE